jgi:hypothetical protein
LRWLCAGILLGISGRATDILSGSHQTKYNPLFSKHSSGHQLIPQFPGFAEQSPDLPVLASGFELLKTFFNISLLLG